MQEGGSIWQVRYLLLCTRLGLEEACSETPVAAVNAGTARGKNVHPTLVLRLNGAIFRAQGTHGKERLPT